MTKHLSSKFLPNSFLPLLLFLSICASGQNILITSPKSIPKVRIDSIANHAGKVFMSDTARVSLSIGIYDHGRQYTYHFGNKTTNIPDDRSLYEIGSITKTMTGMLLANAVIEGKVKLDDDIRKYLDSQYPNLEYQGNPIRLFQLLNHSSGLPFDLPVESEKEVQSYSRDFYKDLHLVKLDTIPGIKLSYSNAAAQLLGFILERIYSKPYEVLLKNYLFSPLKMASSGVNLHSSQLKHLLKGHNGEGTIMPPNQSGAAGGVRSSVRDMLKYLHFEIDESNPVVSLSHKPTWGNIQYYAMGLNWQMDNRTGNPRRVFQSGGTAGFSSNLTLFPDLKIGVILLTNEADKTAQDKLSEAAQSILSVLTK